MLELVEVPIFGNQGGDLAVEAKCGNLCVKNEVARSAEVFNRFG